MTSKNQIAEIINEFLDLTQSLLVNLILKWGPFFVAGMPASFTGYATFQIFHNFDADNLLALVFATIVAGGFETVGIVVTHTCISLYNALSVGQIKSTKFWVMLLMVPVYVVSVIGVIWFSEDTFPPLIKGIAFASPIFTVIVYTAVALSRDLSNITNRLESKVDTEQAKLNDEKAWQRKKEQDHIDFEREQRMRQQTNLQERAMAKIPSNKVPKLNSEYGSFDGQSPVLDTINRQKKQGRDDRILAYQKLLEENPDIGPTEAGRKLNVNRQTIYNYEEILTGNGAE